MTKVEKRQVEDVLRFLQDKSDIESYEVVDNTIGICTKETESDDIEFLKFRIMAAIVLINEKFDKTIDIKVIEDEHIDTIKH